MSMPGYTSFFAIVSNAVDGDLAVFRVDGSTGAIEALARHPAGETVMPLAVSADRRVLHAATRGAQRSIVTWSVDSHTGRLEHLGTTPIASSLAYLSLTPSNAWLLGASYGESSVSVYRANANADETRAPVQVIDGVANAHSVITSADGRFAYVASLGSDTVFCYALTESEAGAQLEPLQAIQVEQGFGPRHLRLSPDSATLYVSSEFRATVAVFARDRENGKLTARGVSPRAAALAHLRDGFMRANAPNAADIDPATLVWGADLQLTPDGRFLYVAERTSSKLLCYRITHDGALDYAGFTDTETQPRGFSIDPGGRFLVATGERSTHVSVYAIDPDSGALAFVSRAEGGRGANWVEIIPQPAAR
jgi:6-phosphogluconolactonase